MDDNKKQRIMDSLTSEQRSGIAEIIRSADIEGGYNRIGDDGGSFYEESTTDTLNSLAYYFEAYDPKSVLE